MYQHISVITIYCLFFYQMSLKNFILHFIISTDYICRSGNVS